MSFAEASSTSTPRSTPRWSRHAAARARAGQRAGVPGRTRRPPPRTRAIRDRIDLGTSTRSWPRPPSPSASPSRPALRGRGGPCQPDGPGGAPDRRLREREPRRGVRPAATRLGRAARARGRGEGAPRHPRARPRAPGGAPAPGQAAPRPGARGRGRVAARRGRRARRRRPPALPGPPLPRPSRRAPRAPEEALRLYGRALEAWPDSQAARLALAHALERSSGPAAPLVLVGATLGASRRSDRADDPWWLYLFGPVELTRAALERVWARALDP